LLCPIGGASTDAAGRVIIGRRHRHRHRRRRSRRRSGARDSRRERAIDDFMGESEFPAP